MNNSVVVIKFIMSDFLKGNMYLFLKIDEKNFKNNIKNKILNI